MREGYKIIAMKSGSGEVSGTEEKSKTENGEGRERGYEGE